MTEQTTLTLQILNDLLTLSLDDIKQWQDECKNFFGEDSRVMEFINKAATMVISHKQGKAV